VNTAFVARQPIFDARERLRAYELLYRSDAAVTDAGPEDPGVMTARVVVGAMLHLGIDSVAGDVQAFVNLGRDQLLFDAWRLFDRDRVVIEVPESVCCTRATLDACTRLVDDGYQLAIDNYTARPESAALIERAHIVKVDVHGTGTLALDDAVRQLSARRVRLLAERVESAAVRDRCLDLGFELFQGYYFSRPQTLTRRTVVPGAVAAMRLVRLLASPSTHDDEIVAAIESDVGMCYMLLRMVNSAAIGGNGIESIGHALRLVGRAALQRWVALLLVAGLGTGTDVRRELAIAAMTRARMCELLTRESPDRANPDHAFLAGLVSLLDTMLEVPADCLADQLRLSPDVAAAVTSRRGPIAPPLMVSEAFEAGAWQGVSEAARNIGVPEVRVPAIYFDAVRWARETMAA
jgi:EAL and modified HD-GYP domain-containing signal transduction protein